MDTSILESLAGIVGKADVIVERQKMLNYLADESPTSGQDPRRILFW